MQHSHASSLSGSHGRSLMAQGLYEAILRFTARDLKLCNALRCMERLRWIEAAQSQVCGAWENDMFVFSNLCDMMWFNCLTERGYQRVDGQLCGLSPNQGSGSNTSPPFQIPAAAANYPALQQQPQHPLEAPQSNAAPLGSFAGHDQV